MTCEYLKNNQRLVRDRIHDKTDMTCIATYAIVEFMKIFKVDGEYIL